MRTRSRFDYTIQDLPNCLCLWKVVEAEALTKTLPNLMSTSLLPMDTKAQCPGISTVLKRWMELHNFFLNYTMIQGLPMLAAPRDRAQVAPTCLPASCYLPECLDGVGHHPTGWRDKHSIDWLLDLPLMLVRGIRKFLQFCFSKVIPRKMEMKHHHDSENVETFSLVTGASKVFAATNLPSVLPAAGLSGARQMYLWDNCTTFC